MNDSPPVRAPYRDDVATWRRFDEDEQRLSAALSERMLERAALRPGHRVLDLGTGRGEPAVRAAARVAPGGRVVGVDPQAAMLDLAAERAAREGVTHLSLHVGDATTLAGVPDGPYDVVLARWVLMYLDDPIAALGAALARLAPCGVLVAATWAEPARVDYWRLPRALLARHAPEAVPALDAVDASAPGTFRYADPSRIEGDFAAAGWRVTSIEELPVPVMESADADDLVAWCLAFGMGRLLAPCAPAVRTAWEADLRAEGERRRGADGLVRLGGVTRIVVAVPA